METCWYTVFFKITPELIVITCRWRRTRRAAHEVLAKVVVRDYHPVFCKEAALLASTILRNPDTLDRHFQRSSTSAIMSILYDYPTLETEHDETITQIHTFVNRLSAASTPGAHLVELFPWMIHIPERCGSILLLFTVDLITWNGGDIRFAKWKRETMEHFRQQTTMFNGLLNTVHSDIVSRLFVFVQK